MEARIQEEMLSPVATSVLFAFDWSVCSASSRGIVWVRWKALEKSDELFSRFGREVFVGNNYAFGVEKTLEFIGDPINPVTIFGRRRDSENQTSILEEEHHRILGLLIAPPVDRMNLVRVATAMADQVLRVRVNSNW
jgi:hypothetical protein